MGEVVGWSTGVKVLAWFCAYLIITCCVSIVFAVLAFVYSVFPTWFTSNLLTVFSIGVPFALLLVGFVSLLPFSEYAYLRQSGTNPAIAREGLRERERKPRKKGWGVVLGIVGITLLLGLNPWSVLLILLSPLLGIPVIALLLTAALILLVIVFRKRLYTYIAS